jgi:hypothetical protein
VVLSPFDSQFVSSPQGFSGFGCEFIDWRHGCILIQKEGISQLIAVDKYKD